MHNKMAVYNQMVWALLWCFFYLENSNDPCRQLTTARSVECALWTVQKPSVFRALLQTKTAKCNYFSDLMLWKCCPENSWKENKIYWSISPQKLHIAFITFCKQIIRRNTSQIPKSAALPLVLLQLYFYGKNQRSKWKESFQLKTCIGNTKQKHRTSRY